MSTKIEIEINEIISKEEIEERAREILFNHLTQKIKEESDRLLGNAAYYCAYQIMDGLITNEQKEFIQNKTLKIIEEMSEHSVFRMKDLWHRDHSVAFNEVESTVRNNREKVVDRVVSVIENFDYKGKLEDDCMEILKDAILKKLTTKEIA